MTVVRKETSYRSLPNLRQVSSNEGQCLLLEPNPSGTEIDLLVRLCTAGLAELLTEFERLGEVEKRLLGAVRDEETQVLNMSGTS